MDKQTHEAADDGTQTAEKLTHEEAAVATAEDTVALLKVQAKLRAGGLGSIGSNKEWLE